MLNVISKLILFYFAYLPLFVILTINNFNLHNQYLYILVTLILILGIILPFILFRTIKSIAPRNEEMEIKSTKNSEYLSFLVTYMTPFLITPSNINELISFLILFTIIIYLYIDTSLFCVNPLLKILYKYNIYEVSLANRTYFLLSKKSHSNETISLSVKVLSTNLLIEEEDNNEQYNNIP